MYTESTKNLIEIFFEFYITVPLVLSKCLQKFNFLKSKTHQYVLKMMKNWHQNFNFLSCLSIKINYFLGFRTKSLLI